MNILVTGGASGLGEAIVRTLSKDRNNTVYFTFVKSKENADKIATEFLNAHPFECDFRNKSEVHALIDSIKTCNLDVLINNAYCGSFLTTHFHKIDSEAFLNEFRENIIPVIEITQSVINEFRKKKRGKIITVLTSSLREKAPVGSSVYISNKAYLDQLVKMWSIENARFNISSNSISPSFMRTNLTANLDGRIIDQIKENNPMKKILTVETVAEAILFLIHAPSEVNGVDILVN